MNSALQRLACRQGTAAEWAAVGMTEILAVGEFGYDSTNKVLKVGDGVTVWNSLPAVAAWSESISLDTVTDGAAYKRIAAARADTVNSGNVTSLVSAATTAAAGLVQLKEDGTNNGVVVQDGDSRLTDARTPTSHAGSHATGEADELTPAAIGAATPTAVATAVSDHAALTNLAHGINNTDAMTALNLLKYNTTLKAIEYAADANVNVALGQRSLIYGKNTSGGVLAKGTVVRISGTVGASGVPTFAAAVATNESTANGTVGVLAEQLAVNGFGFAVSFGLITGLNTDTLTEGAPVYLSTTTGGLQSTFPAAPYQLVRIGYVCYKHSTQGMIFVSIRYALNLNHINDVEITAPTDNQVLTCDAGGIWRNEDNPAIAHIADTTVHVADSSKVAAKFTAANEAGKFYQLSGSVGAAVTLPAGTAVAYFFNMMKTDGTLNLTTPVIAGVAAGGTSVGTATANHQYVGWVRIETP